MLLLMRYPQLNQRIHELCSCRHTAKDRIYYDPGAQSYFTTTSPGGLSSPLSSRRYLPPPTDTHGNHSNASAATSSSRQRNQGGKSRQMPSTVASTPPSSGLDGAGGLRCPDPMATGGSDFDSRKEVGWTLLQNDYSMRITACFRKRA